MDNRKYNIYFHTHTISGIIISVLLYVIFFAGSFSFFKDDISAWQKNNSYQVSKENIHKDYNALIDSLSKHHSLKGRDFDFNLQKNGINAYVTISESHDSTIKKQVKPKSEEVKKEKKGRRKKGDTISFTYDFSKKAEQDYVKNYDMGEFLYRLHFLAQLNTIPIRLGAPFGYLLAGIVSFIFLFALITGLLLHWDKLVSNFFVFRPWSKWKTIWTDLHTALGVIGFPFQFVFAVTGIVLIVNFVLITPYSNFLYNGKSDKLYKALEYSDSSTFAYTYKNMQSSFNLNQFVDDVAEKWEPAQLKTVSIRNYQDSNMHIIITSKVPGNIRFSGAGKIIYRVHDDKILLEKSALTNSSYVDKVRNFIFHLHFGDFGGKPLRVMFFLLGITGCIVINSGVMIWLVARDKNSVPNYKRKFNFWTANVFLSASLSMLPVTAFTMSAILFIPNPGQAEIYNWYFYSWLILGIYFIVRKNLSLINKQSFLLSSITCLLVPILNGIVRNNWIWSTFSKQQFDILFVDLLFLILGVVCWIIYRKLRNTGVFADRD